MRFLIFAILIVTPCIYSQSFNRVFELPKTVFLFLSCGALSCGAGACFLQKRAPMAELRQKISHPVSWWLLIYLAAFFVSCFFSMSKPLSFLGSYERHTGFITVALFTVFYFVAVAMLKRDDVNKILEAMALTAVGVSLVAVLQSFGIFITDLEYIYDMFYRRVFSTLSHPVYLGIYLAMTIPLVVAMIPAGSRFRPVYALALPFMVFALVKTLSRGAFLALALSVFSFVYLYIKYMMRNAPVAESTGRGNWRYAIYSLIFLVFGIGFLFYVFPVLQLRLATLFHFSQESRFEIYKSVFRMIRDYPLFGTGPDTFRISFLPYKTLALARAFPLTNHDQAHNQFLHIWATAGILPFAAYTGLLATTALTNMKVLRQPEATRSARAYALGILCAVIGYTAAMMPAFDNMTTMLLMHVLAVATVVLHKSIGAEKCAPNMEESFDHEKARYALSFLAGIGGMVFIVFGSSLWMAENLSMSGNAAAKIENRIAYYEKARRWMPYESYYDYGLSLNYNDLAFSRKTEKQKRSDLLQASAILESGISYTWQPENYVNTLSRIFIDLGSYEAAESLVLKFLRFDRYSEGLRVDLVLIHGFQGRFKESIDLLEQWIAEFPERDTYFWFAGLTYEDLQDFDNAEKRIARAVELDPANEIYKAELERVRRKLKGLPEPEPPAVLTDKDGLPLIVVENIPQEPEAQDRLTDKNGRPIIVIENLSL